LLRAVWLGFRTLRTQPPLRGRGLRPDCPHYNQSEKRREGLHDFTGARREEDFRIGQQSTHGESNPEHFLVKTTSAKGLGRVCHGRPDSANRRPNAPQGTSLSNFGTTGEEN
jgi:hypothetical protein